MVYRGHVENGVIRVDDRVDLPEGAVVLFEIESAPPAPPSPNSTFAERYAEVMGKARDLPVNAAENVDQYLYGLSGE